LAEAALDPAALFEQQRPRLRGLAYRMLGSVSDAEDVVQEAWLRWHQADPGRLRSAEAWLVTVVTRLAVDRLRRLAAERAAYPGPWLPEPWFEPLEPVSPDRPEARLEMAGDLSTAFLLLLERLGPEERAALLLHDVFDVGYPDIARTLERSEAACRQMVSRARERVRQQRPRLPVTAEARRRLLRQFLAAAKAGNEAELLGLFAPDATYVTDGGGKVFAARRILQGAALLARLVVNLWRKTRGVQRHELWTVNGEPAVLTWIDGQPAATLTIETDGSRILAVHRVLNPDKLTRFPPLPQATGQG
jgi:RNA polymerase sigma-70 factor (ECF subfamily)